MGKILNVSRLDGKVETLEIEGTNAIEDAKGKLLLIPPFVDLLCMGKGDKKAFAQGGNLFLFELCKSNEILEKKPQESSSFRERFLLSADEPIEALAKVHQAEGIVFLVRKELFDSAHVEQIFHLAAQKNWMVWLTFCRTSYGVSENKMVSEEMLEHLRLFLEKALDLDAQVVYLPIATDEELTLVQEAIGKGVTVYPGIALPHLLFSSSSSGIYPSKNLRDKIFKFVEEGKIEFLSSCVGHPDFGPEALFTASHASAILYTLGQKEAVPFEEWVKLAYLNPEQVFGFSREKVGTLIHMERELRVQELNFPLVGNVEYILEGSHLVSLNAYANLV